MEYNYMKHLQILLIFFVTMSSVSAVSLCKPGEEIVFSGPTKSGKQIAVCSTKDAVRYRFGLVGKIELEYPQTAAYSSNQFLYFHYFSAGVDHTSLEFKTPGATSAITKNLESHLTVLPSTSKEIQARW
jgi:hypothetical protein